MGITQDVEFIGLNIGFNDINDILYLFSQSLFTELTSSVTRRIKKWKYKKRVYHKHFQKHLVEQIEETIFQVYYVADILIQHR